MRESISYAFLLNIIIVFIFTCFAVVMGILSYYKAFRANTIILNEIEKYEGYNCISKNEIAKKLSNVGYKTPFNVTCNSRDGKCESAGELGYKVISYNIDFDEGTKPGVKFVDKNNMNSVYFGDSESGYATNKHYQYGVFTYMYVELPVISNLIRIPFFSKTSTLYEFRNFYENNGNYIDTGSYFDDLYLKSLGTDGLLYVKEADINYSDDGDIYYKIDAPTYLMKVILKLSVDEGTNGAHSFADQMSIIRNTSHSSYRERAILANIAVNGTLDASAASFAMSGARHECGYVRDYSQF